MDEIILNSGKKTVTCFAKAFDQVGNFNYTILVSTTPTLGIPTELLTETLFILLLESFCSVYNVFYCSLF